MNEQEQRAIDVAAQALGFERLRDAHADSVRLLDAPARCYWLVQLVDASDATGIAAIDAQDWQPMSTARVASPSATFAPRDVAIAQADLGAHAHAELVWRPCRLSMSPLYPFWRVEAGDDVRYVTHDARVWADPAQVEPRSKHG